MSEFARDLVSQLGFANMREKYSRPGLAHQAGVLVVVQPMRKCAASGFSPDEDPGSKQHRLS